MSHVSISRSFINIQLYENFFETAVICLTHFKVVPLLQNCISRRTKEGIFKYHKTHQMLERNLELPSRLATVELHCSTDDRNTFLDLQHGSNSNCG